MLVRCLYASQMKSSHSQEVLTQILDSSRRNNTKNGITGVLLTTSKFFVQLLEGGRDEVNDLYNTIVRDDRHERVRMMLYEETAERRFENWTMGKVNVDKINPVLLLKYSVRAELDPMSLSGRSMLALITELVQTNAILPR
jgi:hypothetical protein